MPTPNDPDHQPSPDDQERTVLWSAAVDHLEEARRLLALAREEVFQGELHAERAGAVQLSADAAVISTAIVSEIAALRVAPDRSVSR